MTSRADSFSDSIEEISPYAMSTDRDDDLNKRSTRSSFKKMSSFFKSEPKEPKEPKPPKEPKDDAKESTGGGSFFGKSYGKMKGLFKRDAKDDVPDSWAIEETRHVDTHPGSYDMNPSSTLNQSSKPPSRMDKMRMSMRTVFAKPPPAPPVEKTDEDGLPVVVLNEPPMKEIVRMSSIITVLLLLFFLIGVILAACGSLNETAKILGPCFMVLSLFGLCGKAFFTLWWEDDPLPRFQPYWNKLWVHIAPADHEPEKKEPTGTAHIYTGPGYPETYQLAGMSTSPQVVGAYPGNYPTSTYDMPDPYSRVSQVPSGGATPVGYGTRSSGAATPVIYDDTLDTRPRAPSQHSGATSVSDRPPSRQSYASGQGYVNEAADTSNGIPEPSFSTFAS